MVESQTATTRKPRGRRLRPPTASFLLVAACCVGNPAHVDAFSSSSTAHVVVAGSQLYQSETVLFATIENHTDVRTDAETKRQTSIANGQGIDNHSKEPPYLQTEWLSEYGLESSRLHSASSSIVDEAKPFFAHKITSTLEIANGHSHGKNIMVNGKKNSVHVSPPKLNGHNYMTKPMKVPPILDKEEVRISSASTPNSTTASVSLPRVRKGVKALRTAWSHVSPVQIFSSEMQAALDAAAQAEADAEAFEEEDVLLLLDGYPKTKQKTKEEAMVARMSRRKKRQLSSLLKSVNRRSTKNMAGITSRTLTGLITALAEEAEGVSVRINARANTPFWRKQFDSVSIEFTRLGFKPLHMGGPDQQLVLEGDDEKQRDKKKKTSTKLQKLESKVEEEEEEDDCPVAWKVDDTGVPIADISCADTAFNQIDVDNSGALDKDEIAEALVIAASSSEASENIDPDMERSNRKVIQKLAKKLVDLYDTNSDGVIDREEYQSMVDDMAALRQVQKEREEKSNSVVKEDKTGPSLWSTVVGSVMRGNKNQTEAVIIDESTETVSALTEGDDNSDAGSSTVDSTPETTGKIVMENLKMDLRQLVFGAMPFLRHITPGGPLFLEPMKVTVTGSFSAEDIMKSSLLDAGLRQLVSFALRVRVRSFRDVLDGAVFYGRKWKRGSAKAPLVECTELTSVEFDDKDRVIMTGRAKIRASEDAPVIDNSFKLRTKIATPRNGRAIKLSEPEIAIVLECPTQWEQNINKTFAQMMMKPPSKPAPIYTYIPIHSPFKKDDDTGGYFMGDDNQLKSLSIKDKCLRFEMEAILRPGRFLGSHYLAFTVPQRALIITVDRVREGMRAARRRKKALKELKLARAAEVDRKAHHAEDAFEDLDSVDLDDDSIGDSTASTPISSESLDDEEDDDKNEGSPIKGFITRFVDGYLQAGAAGAAEENKEKLEHAISDWFGRQGLSDSKVEGNSNSAAGIESPRRVSEVSKIVEEITMEEIRD